MSFLPISNRSGVLAGVYLVNAVVAPLAVFYNVGFALINRIYSMLNLTHPPSGPPQTLAALQNELSLLLLLAALFPSEISSGHKPSRPEMLRSTAQLS